MDLTRSETKAITRRRLLDAALQIIDEQGESALTTTKVTKLAGVAQSSFYVHFADMSDLLHSLIDELAIQRRRQTRRARESVGGNREAFRDTFRVVMREYIAHPRLFRLLARSRLDPTSVTGEWSRAVWAGNRDALVDDLFESGFPDATDTDRRRAEMVADGLIALTETFTLGHLDGRFPDLEEVVRVLEAFSLGYFTLYQPDAEPGHVVSVATQRLGWTATESGAGRPTEATVAPGSTATASE